MIRINLLPDAPRQRAVRVTRVPREDSIWRWAYGGGVLVTLCGLTLVFMQTQGELAGRRAEMNRVRKEIRVAENRTRALREMEATKKRMESLAGSVYRLYAQRVGPAEVLKELSAVLTPGQGGSAGDQAVALLRTATPRAGTSRTWDTRRVWLTAFEEEESDDDCKLRGLARTNDDVAEFMRRLSLSPHFTQVSLDRTEVYEGKEGSVPMIAFTLSTKILYESAQ